jgi:hypothetical protein
LSPANALDAVSIATAIRAVVIILIMVNSEICSALKTFKCLYAGRLVFGCRVVASTAKAEVGNPNGCNGFVDKIAAGAAASTVNR